MKKLAALFLAASMVVLSLAGCSGPGTANNSTGSGGSKQSSGGSSDGVFTIGYCNSADTDVFDMSRKTALIEATKDDDRIEIKFADSNQDPMKQLGDADTFIAQGVDMLILVPNDSEAIVPAIEAAAAAGIPVMCLGIKAASGDFTFVGSQNYDSGYMQGEFFAENLPENGTVLYLAGTAGMDHSTARRNGFQDALAAAGRTDVKILADLDGNYEKAKAMQITEDWIQKFPQFDAIVAANDQMALGAVEALKGANRLEGVMISGIDGVPEAYAAIENGEMVQTILQDAPGQALAAYDVIKLAIDGKELPVEVLVPFQSVTIENLADFKK